MNEEEEVLVNKKCPTCGVKFVKKLEDAYNAHVARCPDEFVDFTKSLSSSSTAQLKSVTLEKVEATGGRATVSLAGVNYSKEFMRRIEEKDFYAFTHTVLKSFDEWFIWKKPKEMGPNNTFPEPLSGDYYDKVKLYVDLVRSHEPSSGVLYGFWAKERAVLNGFNWLPQVCKVVGKPAPGSQITSAQVNRWLDAWPPGEENFVTLWKYEDEYSVGCEKDAVHPSTYYTWGERCGMLDLFYTPANAPTELMHMANNFLELLGPDLVKFTKVTLLLKTNGYFSDWHWDSTEYGPSWHYHP